MEAVILAGGFGTRLAHIVKDVPKPMAPVQGRPFLQYLLDWCKSQGIRHVVLAVGYKRDCIENYFGTTYHSIKLSYSVEDTPLFTGGALKQALQLCTEEHIAVLNGDTFFDVPLTDMMAFHREEAADVTIAVKQIRHSNRYGTVQVSGYRITNFMEKTHQDECLINGGVYVINRTQLNTVDRSQFSFESDVLEGKLCHWKLCAFACRGYFIDIGIEQDYFQAQNELLQWRTNKI